MLLIVYFIYLKQLNFYLINSFRFIFLEYSYYISLKMIIYFIKLNLILKWFDYDVVKQFITNLQVNFYLADYSLILFLALNENLKVNQDIF